MRTRTNLDPDRRTARGFVAAGALVLVVMVGALVASSAAGSSPAQESPPSDTVATSGPQAVAGPDGTVAGWIDADDWQQANLVGPPTRTYGTGGVELQSLEVHDASGSLVGYYTTGPLGFIPLATAEDASTMDALLAEVAASHP